MLKRLIVLFLFIAGVCGVVFAKGKQEYLTRRHSGTEDIKPEVVVFPQLGQYSGNR